VQRSDGVRDGMLAFYEAVSSNDAGRFDELVEMGEATLVIGTAPGEFVRERERLLFGFEAEGYRLSPGPSPVGYEEGVLGWVVDEPILHMGENEIQTRVTAILRWSDAKWKLLHAHFSVGVPDEEVVDLQRKWGGG
jgi:hypothetical protein